MPSIGPAAKRGEPSLPGVPRGRVRVHQLPPRWRDHGLELFGGAEKVVPPGSCDPQVSNSKPYLTTQSAQPSILLVVLEMSRVVGSLRIECLADGAGTWHGHRGPEPQGGAAPLHGHPAGPGCSCRRRRTRSREIEMTRQSRAGTAHLRATRPVELHPPNTPPSVTWSPYPPHRVTGRSGPAPSRTRRTIVRGMSISPCCM